MLAFFTCVWLLGISACSFQHHVASRRLTSRLYCAVIDHPEFVKVLSQKLRWTYAHTFKLVWLCMRRSVGQHAIKGIARPAVVPHTRSVQLPGVLYTPTTIQVRSMVVTLGTTQSTQIQGLHACVHGLCSRCVSAASHTCMSHLVPCRACSHVVCSQRLHSRL